VREEQGTSKDSLGTPFADRIEVTVESFFRFASRYIETAKRLTSPFNAYAISATTSRRPVRNIVLPYTFLTLAYFPFAIILAATSDTIWDVLLNPERSAAQIVKNFSAGPSPTQILISALPALIVILGLRRAITVMFRVRQSGKTLLQRLLAYAYGFQFLLATLLLLLLVVGHTSFISGLFPPFVATIAQWFAVPALFYGLLVFALFYPCVALLWASFRLRRQWRFRTAPAFVAVLVLVGSIAIVYCGTFPGRVSTILKPHSGIESSFISPLQVSQKRDVVIGLYLLVQNATDETIIVKDREFGVQLKNSQGKIIPRNAYKATLCDWSDHADPIMAIRSGDVKWIRLVFDLRIDSALFSKASSSGYVSIKAFQLSGPIRVDWSNVLIAPTSLHSIVQDCHESLDFPS
jgi:hypothetical protein